MIKKNFNIIIAGIGGQGLITLLQIIAEAAMIEGFDVKTSELHGLSQRGGSVETHIRFGEKIYSPLVQAGPPASATPKALRAGEADLILSLEMSETLKVINYSGPGTVFLANRYIISYQGGLSEKEIIEKLNVFAKGEKYFIPASEICQRKLGNEIVSGIYLLGFASFKKLIPLKAESFLKAISKTVPERYLELNIKAFELAIN